MKILVVAYTLFYQDTQNTVSSTLGAGNLYNMDPLFASLPNAGPDGVWDTLDDAYSGLVLLSGSPAIDAGVTQYRSVSGMLVPPTPITGFSGRAPDLGWKESTGTAPSPTNTPAPVASNTPAPVASNTPAPVASSTPTPRPTSTPVNVVSPTPSPVYTPVISPTGVYYVDCASGNDTFSGTSEAQAWRTLTKASSAPLNAGNQLLLKRGCVWSDETLTISRSGLAGQEILVGAYGTGNLPQIQRQTTGTSDVKITGSYIIIENLYASALPPKVDAGCQNNPVGNIVGFSFEAGSHDNILRNSSASALYAGVFVRSGSHHNHIQYNQFFDNIMMSPLDAGGSGDAGAFGVLLWGDDNEIAFNRISGSNACSYDYGRDGSAVEIYGGQRNIINRNIGVDDDVFTELGNSRSADNTYAYNVFSSNLNESIFLVTRGTTNSYGPVYGTHMYNNTVYLTGAQSQGFVCHGGCSSSILISRNNIFQSPYKVGYADAAFDEDYNLYWGGGTVQFTTGSHSKQANPLFVNPGSGDFHLQAGSPAIDAGVGVSYSTDVEGNPVPMGSVPDLGAYEVRSGPVTSTATPMPTNTPSVLPTTAPLATATGVPGSATTLQFTAQADARVEEAHPSTNYGSASQIRVDAGTDWDVESDLQFSVAGVSGAVVSAKLRIYAIDPTVNGPAVYGTSSSWIESGTDAITWNTRAARASGVIADLGAVNTYTWMEFNVTPLVTGNNTYSFLLATDNTDGLTMASRETNTPPQLVVVFDPTAIPQPTATAQPQPTATVQPTSAPLATATAIPSRIGNAPVCRSSRRPRHGSQCIDQLRHGNLSPG